MTLALSTEVGPTEGPPDLLVLCSPSLGPMRDICNQVNHSIAKASVVARHTGRGEGVVNRAAAFDSNSTDVSWHPDSKVFLVRSDLHQVGADETDMVQEVWNGKVGGQVPHGHVLAHRYV
eukprot:CAMPEP_0113922358 /NCGR_PEP_ID=MMETSP1159-20121227/1567_1 /TAXON_ID=88271 /ORGANISM="Picocystis salinarum" /LENGTH=119 /DNA_ID=CAMNT_0000922455 /DNA_START=120 /DNA_END=481 /DNA_ORIENTATION=- /assembly_acc=CAM_ASM_000767